MASLENFLKKRINSHVVVYNAAWPAGILTKLICLADAEEAKIS